MASVSADRVIASEPPLTLIHLLGQVVIGVVTALGDFTCFSVQSTWGLWRRWPRSGVLWPVLYEVGFRSMPVILTTGLFIGMVLALQSYDQLRAMGFENRMGALINVSLVKELGPVLAATMLAGRVGSAMAAEIGTMKVTEQIDALRALGAEPIYFLVTPRLLACVCLIPSLTLLADAVGMVGGWAIGTGVFGVNSYFYWNYADNYVTTFDVITGLIKSLFFGAAIAIVACQRGFQCGSGAEGVGRAATQSFVTSFMLILGLDFALGAVLLEVQRAIGGSQLMNLF